MYNTPQYYTTHVEHEEQEYAVEITYVRHPYERDTGTSPWNEIQDIQITPSPDEEIEHLILERANSNFERSDA